MNNLIYINNFLNERVEDTVQELRQSSQAKEKKIEFLTNELTR